MEGVLVLVYRSYYRVLSLIIAVKWARVVYSSCRQLIKPVAKQTIVVTWPVERAGS